VDFVEICNVYVGKMIIKAAKRIFNSDKICRSYSDLNFGVTFFGTQCRRFRQSSDGLKWFAVSNWHIALPPITDSDEKQKQQV